MGAKPNQNHTMGIIRTRTLDSDTLCHIIWLDLLSSGGYQTESTVHYEKSVGRSGKWTHREGRPQIEYKNFTGFIQVSCTSNLIYNEAHAVNETLHTI